MTHPQGEGTFLLGSLFLGGSDPGYLIAGDARLIPHRVIEVHQWTNPYGAHFTNWRAACGAKGTKTGHRTPFGKVTQCMIRQLEACLTCWQEVLTP